MGVDSFTPSGDLWGRGSWTPGIGSGWCRLATCNFSEGGRGSRIHHRTTEHTSLQLGGQTTRHSYIPGPPQAYALALQEENRKYQEFLLKKMRVPPPPLMALAVVPRRKFVGIRHCTCPKSSMSDKNRFLVESIQLLVHTRVAPPPSPRRGGGVD